MSDIPGSSFPVQTEGAQYRSPVSESLIQSLGGPINLLLARNLQWVKFASYNTWVVPTGINQVLLVGCGGGGGGCGEDSSFLATGGDGCGLVTAFALVTPTDTVTITIGAGGTGGNSAGGQTGGNTIFAPTANPTYTFYGAYGGKSTGSGYTYLYPVAPYHTRGGYGGVPGQPWLFPGGSNFSSLGGGGAGAFGPGGNGNAAALSTSYGAGGGGGISTGFAGAQGILYVGYYG